MLSRGQRRLSMHIGVIGAIVAVYGLLGGIYGLVYHFTQNHVHALLWLLCGEKVASISIVCANAARRVWERFDAKEG